MFNFFVSSEAISLSKWLFHWWWWWWW